MRNTDVCAQEKSMLKRNVVQVEFELREHGKSAAKSRGSGFERSR